MQLYGHIPENGESVLHENLLLTVMEMDGNRIDILKITRKKPGQPDKSGEETGEKED